MPRKPTGSVRYHRGGYEGRITLDGQRFTVRGANEAEVRAKLAKLRTSPPAPKADTLAHFLTKQWLPALEIRVNEGSFKASTLDKYERDVRNYWLPTLGQQPLAELRRGDIIAVLDGWRGTVAPGTILNRFRCLHTALEYAVERDIVASNPASGITVRGVVRRRPVLWTLAQAQRFLKEAQDEWYFPLWALLLATGCREGEALALTWDTVDIERGTVHIGATAVWLHGKEYLVQPKTPSGYRTVPLALPEAVEALRRLPRRGHRVFLRPNGEVAYHYHVSKPFLTTCDRLGLPRCRLHDLRHFTASLLLAHGVPLPEVSQILGHANVQITARIYSHLLGRDFSKSIAVLSQFGK